jgi:hypothetical protein
VTAAASEVCDGSDADCDGAVDEGCPCTAGDTRECGVEFLTAPCMGGTQTCSAGGAWSGCEGAIGPTADTCDGIDNDCDGTVDPGCGCVPTAEICRDGIDNDCDDETDEPACTPDWRLDAGIPTDAGTTPTDAGHRTCIDETTMCVGSPGGLTAAGVEMPVGRGRAGEITSDGTRLFVLYRTGGGTGTAAFYGPLRIAILAADGMQEHDVMLSSTAEQIASPPPHIAWNGTHAVAVWREHSGASMFTRIASDGSFTPPTEIDPGVGQTSAPHVASDSTGLAFAWTRQDTSAGGVFQRRALDGTSAGPIVRLGEASEQFVTNAIAPFGGGFVITGMYTAPDPTSTRREFIQPARVYFVEGDVVRWSVDFVNLEENSSGWRTISTVATNCERALVCWRNTLEVTTLPRQHVDRCQMFDLSGAPMTSPMELFAEPRFGSLYGDFDAVWMNGDFLLRVSGSRLHPDTPPGTLDPRAGEWFVVIDPGGAISSAQRTSEGSALRDQGDMTLLGDCAVAITAGLTASDGSPGQMRRICETACP